MHNFQIITKLDTNYLILSVLIEIEKNSKNSASIEFKHNFFRPNLFMHNFQIII